MRVLLLVIVAGLVLNVSIPWLSANEPIRFDRDIRPILSDKCFHCHGPDSENRAADLRLDLESTAKEWAIEAGHADDSLVIERVFSDDEDLRMPPPESNKTLSEQERDLLRRWIDQGAAWTTHWSFTPPQTPEPPAPSEPWRTNAIDDFVLRGLRSAGLQPSPPAQRTTLIRRLPFDLTGLPPTLDEIENYLSDSSPRAYERVVDRLLASQHFGERMAIPWLDAARYGDTSVYHADGPRDMWAWRDAVVRSYNENMPFDQFSIAQLAGDLLPDASLHEQILAGFNRNNGTTDEGGAIAEEYRVEYAVDRVKTTSTVWLGLTMECAQCHDHKYDPISQEDYYRFYAFFNRSADKGMQTRKGNAEPLLSIPDPDRKRRLPGVQQQLKTTREELKQLKAQAEPEFLTWLDNQQATTPAIDFLQEAMLDVRLTEGQGRKISDTLCGNQGKLVGKVEWVTTPFDHGLRFSGNNYVDLGSTGDFERDDSFSYGGWVKPTQGIGAMLARMDDGNSYRGYDLYVGTNGVSVHVIHRWPDNAIKVTTDKKLKKDQWYHIFATYDGSSQAAGIKIFVNGESWDWHIEQDGLTDSIRTDKTLLIGSRHPGSRLRGEVDCVSVFPRQLTSDEVQQLAQVDPIQSLLALPTAQRSEAQTETLRDHFLAAENPAYAELKHQLDSLEKQVTALQEPLTTVMIMGDMSSPRDTFILNRGAYDAPTEHKVEPGVPSVLPPLPDDAPQNRLGLARWLFDPDHPLTTRVAINRYWQRFMGRGLVATPEDFGAQGQFPSHPELLDWLANDFRHDWNVKRAIKQIVMSSTYRQSSRADVDAYRQDPANEWLARGPRFRLQAEFVRDMALSLGGLLNRDVGGPGVKPYQPPGLWVEVGLSGKPAFVQDHGTKLYRRSLYTYWKRSAPPPAMQIFDAPTREKCTIRRPRTNTPLQALVVLNDPQFVEAARKFAARLLSSSVESDFQRMVTGFRMAAARLPKDSEVQLLLDVLQQATEKYTQHPEMAEQLLQTGESARPTDLDPAAHAAWTVVASTLMNLDETLTRE